ncbi:MAG TPA: DUF192 domain-containing protein [Candidatus Woesebacteria bacterium]|nr:DUF192 domain-containing protein [Candidatus Woesebacteria bacterium]
MKLNRNIIIAVIFCIVITIIVVGYILKSKIQNSEQMHMALWSNYQIQEKTIEGKKLKLVVADTPERWTKGLMFVRKPTSEFDGMIFMYPDYQYRTYWNMNTFEDLTLYWMKDDTVSSTTQLPSIEKSKEIVRVSSSEPVNIVVEVIN